MRLCGLKLSPKNVALIAAAVIAAAKAAETKTTNPTASLILAILPAVLTVFVDAPRGAFSAPQSRHHAPALTEQELARLSKEEAHWESEGGR